MPGMRPPADLRIESELIPPRNRPNAPIADWRSGVMRAVKWGGFLLRPSGVRLAITEWEDVLGLATFGIIGALCRSGD